MCILLLMIVMEPQFELFFGAFRDTCNQVFPRTMVCVCAWVLPSLSHQVLPTFVGGGKATRWVGVAGEALNCSIWCRQIVF